MPEFSDIAAFFKAVFWKNLFTIIWAGGVPPLVIRLIVWITGKPVPLKLHLKWGLLIGVSVATFMAWNEEHTRSQNLFIDNERLSSAEEDKKKAAEDLRKSEKVVQDLRITLTELKRDNSELSTELKEFKSKLGKAVFAQKAAKSPVSRLCFNEPLRFNQSRVPASLNGISNYKYNKQVTFWPRLSAVELGHIRIHGSDYFRAEITVPGSPIHYRGGHHGSYDNYEDYDLRGASTSTKDPMSITLVSEFPFEVLCIDKLPTEDR